MALSAGFLFFGIQLVSTVSLSCPAALFGHEILPRMEGKREGIHFFARGLTDSSRGGEGGESLKEWNSLPYQIDRIDDAGHIVFGEENYLKDSLRMNDLIMFNTTGFGQRVDIKKDVLPCKATKILELRDSVTNKFAYLAQCNTASNHAAFPKAVEFDRLKNTLKSKKYLYEFNEQNYMQFNRIKLANDQNQYEEVARDSKLIITSDVKNFFTLHFNSRQIESNLEKSKIGSIANLARLSFYLRILFFKLDMSLSTDVAFFEDSGHIPMMINLPVDSFRYLNPKSGILYTWVLPKSAKEEDFLIHMPKIDPTLIEKGWQKLGEHGEKFCVKSICSYRFTSMTKAGPLTMKMDLDSQIVKKGFFPQFVIDVSKYKKEMDWEIEETENERRIGMYFEFSGLPKGGHPWNFWLKMTKSGLLNYQCPTKVAMIPKSIEPL